MSRIGIASDHGGYDLKKHLFEDAAGVRACLIHETFSAHQGVEDDDLNMIALGGLVKGYAFAWDLVQTFLAVRFRSAERFRRRLAKIANLEAV